MTGEMSSINQKGEDSNGDCWSLHAAVARAVKGRLKPFDQYQGPYIVALDSFNREVRLWIMGGMSFDDTCCLYREDNNTRSQLFWPHQTRRACRMARELLAQGEVENAPTEI